MKKYRIRKIQKKDNPFIASIIRTVMKEYKACGEGFSIEDKEVDFMFESYQDKACYFVVEILENEKWVIGGGAGVAKLQGMSNNDVCELKKMYFSQKYRSQGFGGEMLMKCQKIAQQIGYKEMYLETHDNMKEAVMFYEKNGFIKINHSLGNTGHYSCNLFYKKSLRE